MVVEDDMMIYKRIGQVLDLKINYTSYKQKAQVNFIVFTEHEFT